MAEYKKFFKGKKVTVMGLGLLGRGVGDALFLAENGAILTVTDLKTKAQLRESLGKLKKYKGIKYVLGRHKLEDFRNTDLVLKAAGVPLDSMYIKEAKKHDVPVEMSAALFARFSDLPVVGVTGTRGKSTVAHLIAHILDTAGKKVILGGNIRGVSNLQLLKKAPRAEIAVMELDSWQLQGFGESQISPHIAVFTNFLSDHLNYYNNDAKKYFSDKAYIYEFQKKNDFLILGPQMKNIKPDTRSKIIRISTKDINGLYTTSLLGRHNLENIACAIEATKLLGVGDRVMRKAIKSFKTIPGRLERVAKINGVDIYNDTNSTTPDATIAALYSFPGKVVLIMGGMDKNLKVDDLEKILPKKTKHVFIIPGSGGHRIRCNEKNLERVKDIEEAVTKAMMVSKSGDTILFSPGFASFNMFQNEYDRGEQFVKIVKKI